MMDSVVIAALVSGCVAIVVVLIQKNQTKKRASLEGLEENLKLAEKDIAFLLAVESKHCEIHRFNEGSSKKNTVRESVRTEQGMDFSGSFNPGSVRSRARS